MTKIQLGKKRRDKGRGNKDSKNSKKNQPPVIQEMINDSLLEKVEKETTIAVSDFTHEEINFNQDAAIVNTSLGKKKIQDIDLLETDDRSPASKTEMQKAADIYYRFMGTSPIREFSSGRM